MWPEWRWTTLCVWRNIYRDDNFPEREGGRVSRYIGAARGQHAALSNSADIKIQTSTDTALSPDHADSRYGNTLKLGATMRERRDLGPLPHAYRSPVHPCRTTAIAPIARRALPPQTHLRYDASAPPMMRAYCMVDNQHRQPCAPHPASAPHTHTPPGGSCHAHLIRCIPTRGGTPPSPSALSEPQAPASSHTREAERRRRGLGRLG